MNRSKTYYSFQVGQLVYVYKAKGTIVHIGSRKIVCYFVGPLVIYRSIGPNQFLLMSLTGQIYPLLVEETRPKPGALWTAKGNVHYLAELKQVLSAGVKISSLLGQVLYIQLYAMFTCSLISFFYYRNSIAAS